MTNQIPTVVRKAALLLALAGAPALAQSDMQCTGSVDLFYTGGTQDFLVPDSPGYTIQLTARGADGGDAYSNADGGECHKFGGEGATAYILCRIGYGQGELAPGGVIRFIVGGRGGVGSYNSLDTAGSGGGGGSGVLYLPPGDNRTWEDDGVVLVAAGGGGGAVASSCWPNWDGQPCCSEGRYSQNGLNAAADPTSTCGKDGGNAGYDRNGRGSGFAGCDGGGGMGWHAHATGGAGAFEDAWIDGYQDPYGDAQRARKGFPNGGAGAIPGNSHDGGGGWGFGGGGTSFVSITSQNAFVSIAGGGGYSGGGGSAGDDYDSYGGDALNYGGAGASYLNTAYAVLGDMFETNDYNGNSIKDGRGHYIIISTAPEDTPDGAIALSDGVPVASPSLCGLTAEPFGFCGDTVTGPDLWYSYTNATACTRDVTIQVSSGIAVIYGYNGAPFDQNGCRYQSDGGGFYLDTLGPGETIMLRVADIYTDSFTLVASSTYAAGQADCDSDGIPDACDISDDCPPSNDNCADAIPLAPGVYPYDMRFANVDGSSSCSGPDYHDIWYTFTAPADGQLGLIDQAEPLQGDRSITFLDGCGGNELACVGSYNQRPAFPNTWTTAFLPMKAGEEVTIRLTSNTPADDFAFGDLLVVFDEAFTNDRCEDATLLEPQIGQTLTVPFDTTYAENSGNLPDCIGFDYLDAWFVFQAPADGPVTIDTQGTPWYFSGLSLYDACAGNEIACDNSANQGGAWASIDYDATLGQTIYVRVSGYSWAGSGAGLLNITIPEPCAGDFNGDGSVNTLDVLAFLNAWSAHDPRGDFNADGAINTLDVLAFLNAWATGC